MARTPSSTTKLALAGVAATAVSAIGLAAPVAQAAPRDGRCEAGEFCYFFNSDQHGAVSDFAGSLADYGTRQPSCFEFRGGGAGSGRCIKNQAAAVWNRTTVPVTVFFNTGFKGASQTFAPGARANLSRKLKNENASHRFGGAPAPTPTPTPTPNPPKGTVAMSRALYQASGGHVSCGFDGYHNTPGRHEGIDIARSVGSPVHALVAGTVTNVSRGARGGSGLSTIAVYDAKAGKTVVYLHSAPLGSLRTGQAIERGQRIATEDYRGVSDPDAAHTHVEMRIGRKTLAAKSVGDPRLDNPNPTAFWRSQGYAVR